MDGERSLKLAITIDTEEDNWLPYSPSGYQTQNSRRIPQLQELFDEFGAKPTYLVTYQMARCPVTSAILRSIHDRGACEIGTHCHPWSQPPHEENPEIANSMLCNLPSSLQARKIGTLHEILQNEFGFSPKSFRSGRWGYSPAVAETLLELSYAVDTSILAHTDWTSCFGPDFSMVSPRPFRFDPPSIFQPIEQGALLEVPASVEFLQRRSSTCNAVFEGIRRSPLRHLRLVGMLNKLGMLNKVALTPELTSEDLMLRLIRSMKSKGYPLATMWFHSSTLMPGLTPYVHSEEDAGKLLGRIRSFLTAMPSEGVRTVTLSEAHQLLLSATGETGLAVDTKRWTWS